MLSFRFVLILDRLTHEVIPIVIRVSVREGQESKVLHVLMPEEGGEEFIVDDVLVLAVENPARLLKAHWINDWNSQTHGMEMMNH